MIQNTGKGGLYRYYCCSSKLKKGPSACRGLRTPMEKLDEIVVGEVARQVLDPDRLTAMLDAYVQSAAAQADGAKAQIAKLRHDHTAAVAGIARLLELVEKGLMEPEDPAMRERLVALKLQRDQIAKEIGELQNRMASSTPTITPEKVARVGGLLRDKLYEGPPEFRQAYARLLMDEVRVTDEEIRISGSKSVLARCAARRGRRTRAQSSLFCSGVARPTGFEPVTSAFGGQLSEACGRLPGGIAYRQPEKSHSPALKRSGTHRTSLSLLSVLLCYDVFFSNRGHRISKGRERD